MKLHEEFKLFEDMWEDDYAAEVPATSSVQVSLNGWKGEKILDKKCVPHKEAYEALLKTLEEPPAHVIFIMATTDAYKVPVTITSRALVYTFKINRSICILQIL